MIKADEDAMSRMLGVPVAQIPEAVLAEYRFRLRLFHCNGSSGPLGPIGLIDMIRSMGLGRPPCEKRTIVDWSRVPTDGSVPVVARTGGENGQPKWVSGVYAGQVGTGKLVIRLDGDKWVREFRRDDVRIARGRQAKPATVSPKDAAEDAVDSDSTLAEQEPWVSLPRNEVVMVEADDDLKEGHFQGVQDDEILVTIDDELTPRAFAPGAVTCLDTTE